MKKFTLILFLSAMLCAQIDGDMDDEAEAIDLNSVDCTIEANESLHADSKYDGSDLSLRLRMWYSEANQYYKKWRKEKDPAKLKTYAEQMEINFWKLLVNDPTGIEQAKFPSGATRARTLMSIEKLSDLYLQDNNVEMIKEIVSRALKNFNDDYKMQQLAATYYSATENEVCAVKHFEKWYELYPVEEKENRIKILETIISKYSKLNQNELAINTCDRILELDPSRTDIEELKAKLIGDPEKVYAVKSEMLKSDPDNVKLMHDVARLAVQIDLLKVANELYIKLEKIEPNNTVIKEKLTEINFEFQNYSAVITYGKNLESTRHLEKVIQSYVALGQYKNGYYVASKVQSKNSADGHYLKGFVYEKTAQAASEDGNFSKKQFEWRLIYRLAYIEYYMGGGNGKDRAKRIIGLIPNKGDVFLKNNRIKPQTGKYSEWINWDSSYDKEVYAPAN